MRSTHGARSSIGPSGHVGSSGSLSRSEGPGSAVVRQSADDAEYYNQVFTQRVNLWQTNDAFKELLFQPELGQFVGQMAGVVGFHVWHDQALIKQAYANPTAFHLDVPYWSFTSPDAITIWIALDDAHARERLSATTLRRKPQGAEIRQRRNRTRRSARHCSTCTREMATTSAAVPCPVSAGGALLHNGLTFHGAGPNMTPGRRRAITCAYMPDGSAFHGRHNVPRPEYLEEAGSGKRARQKRRTRSSTAGTRARNLL